MMYVDYAWSAEASERFRKTPHRARYLLCDGLLNPPGQGNSSVHCIQYASHATYQLFATERPSLIVLQTGTAYFAMSTRDLGRLCGRMKHNDLQFSQVSKLWHVDEDRMERFRCPDVQRLYEQLTGLCADKRSVAVTVGELSGYVPRPARKPDPAQLLSAGEGSHRSGPRSTKGSSRPRKRKRRKGESPGEPDGQELGAGQADVDRSRVGKSASCCAWQ